MSTSLEYNPWGAHGHRTQARYTHRGTRPSDTGPIYTSKSHLDVYIGHEYDGCVPPPCVYRTRVQWLCTPSLMLAPASTLLPGPWPGGPLALGFGCMLQTTNWDTPQQNTARTDHQMSLRSPTRGTISSTVDPQRALGCHRGFLFNNRVNCAQSGTNWGRAGLPDPPRGHPWGAK